MEEPWGLQLQGLLAPPWHRGLAEAAAAETELVVPL